MKTSGEQDRFPSGMVRDSGQGKLRFDLLVPEGISYEDQPLVRLARLMQHGAGHYGARNWEKADSPEELARFRESAFRHFMAWFCGEDDEDHMASTCFNLFAAEYVKRKMAAALESVPPFHPFPLKLS